MQHCAQITEIVDEESNSPKDKLVLRKEQEKEEEEIIEEREEEQHEFQTIRTPPAAHASPVVCAVAADHHGWLRVKLWN